jgi:tetratricopeptide (TPR) repeat protein
MPQQNSKISESGRSDFGRFGPLFLALSIAAAHAWPSAGWPEAGLVFSSAFCLAALWALAAWWTGQAGLRTGAVLAGAAWTAWALYGAMRTAVPGQGAEMAANAVGGFIVFFGAALWTARWAIRKPEEQEGKSDRAAETLLWGAALIAIPMALYGVWQLLIEFPAQLRDMEANPSLYSADPITRDALMHHMRERRIGGTFGDGNVCAALFSLCAGLGLALPAAARRRWRVPAWGAGIAVIAASGAGTALTQSRGGAATYLAALAGGGLIVWMSRRAENAPKSKRRWRPLAAACAGLLSLGVLIYGFFATPLGAEWRRRIQTKAGVMQSQRVYYLQTAWRMASERPWQGYGAGSYELRYPLYRSPGSNETKDPHNWAARYGAELGAIGLGLFLLWLVLACRPLGPLGFRLERTCALRAAAVLGAGVLLLNGLGELSIRNREIYIDFCLMLGIASGIGASPSAAAKKRWAAGALAAVIALFSAWSAWAFLLNSDRVEMRQRESGDCIQIAEALRAEGRPAEAQHWARRSIDALEQALRLSPDNPELMDKIAQMQTWVPELRDLPQARAWAEKAIAVHPLSANLRDHLATILLQSGEEDAAILEWDRATGCHPLDEQAFASRAMAHAAAKRWTLAIEDARRAKELAVRSGNLYRNLYDEILRKAKQHGYVAPGEL